MCLPSHHPTPSNIHTLCKLFFIRISQTERLSPVDEHTARKMWALGGISRASHQVINRNCYFITCSIVTPTWVCAAVRGCEVHNKTSKAELCWDTGVYSWSVATQPNVNQWWHHWILSVISVDYVHQTRSSWNIFWLSSLIYSVIDCIQ